MNRIVLVFFCAVLVAPVLQSSDVAGVPSHVEASPLLRHLDTAMSQIDRGARSREYRESLAFLRTHAAEAVAEVSGVLLEEPGSFRKWQSTYLLGEFGDESAMELLRLLIDEPLPQPQPARDGSHEIDLAYAEEIASRVQAVMSTARIASHRPHLRDQVVAKLVAIAREVPFVKSTALFELRKLLGPEAQTMLHYFEPEDAKHFDPFMPPSEWQALLGSRIKEHQRQERENRDTRQPLCYRK